MDKSWYILRVKQTTLFLKGPNKGHWEVKAAILLSASLRESKQTQTVWGATGTKQGALNNGLVSCTCRRAEGKGKGKTEQAGMREKSHTSGPGRDGVGKGAWGKSYCAETCEGDSAGKTTGVQLLRWINGNCWSPCWDFATVPNCKVLRDTCSMELYSSPIPMCGEGT